MARPAIVWRNPNYVHHRRRWTRVRHEVNRSLYLVLESVSAHEDTWCGLPELEVVRGGANARANAKEAAAVGHYKIGKTRFSLWGRL